MSSSQEVLQDQEAQRSSTKKNFESSTHSSITILGPPTLQRNVLAVCVLLQLILLLRVYNLPSSSSPQYSSSASCPLFFGDYKGPVYDSPESGTLDSQCLLESKWMKVSQHTVQFPGSSSVLDDWMWVDYHDRINVVVEDSSSSSSSIHDEGERRFWVFEQTKYALEGRQSLAIIGGIVEPGEEPEHAARREVEEEMNGIQCQDFHFLGRYRTDVNRGMGWVNGFLAMSCSSKDPKHSHDHELNPEDTAEEVGAADTERQDLKSISQSEMKTAVGRGEFIEVQWTATVSLALLHPALTQ